MLESKQMTRLIDDVIEAWRVHNEVVLFGLRHTPDAGLEAVTLLKNGQPSRGRTVVKIYAHICEVRYGKLKRSATGAAELPEIKGSDAPSRDELLFALERSGELVAVEMRAALEAGRPVKGFKRSAISWMSYLMAHENHHRGQIAQALKQSACRPPKEVSYGSWGYWGGYELKEPQ